MADREEALVRYCMAIPLQVRKIRVAARENAILNKQVCISEAKEDPRITTNALQALFDQRHWVRRREGVKALTLVRTLLKNGAKYLEKRSSHGQEERILTIPAICQAINEMIFATRWRDLISVQVKVLQSSCEDFNKHITIEHMFKGRREYYSSTSWLGALIPKNRYSYLLDAFKPQMDIDIRHLNYSTEFPQEYIWQTVLQMSCTLRSNAGAFEAAKLMLRYGANVNKPFFMCTLNPLVKQETTLHVAEPLPVFETCGRPFHFAILYGNLPLLQLLIQNGADTSLELISVPHTKRGYKAIGKYEKMETLGSKYEATLEARFQKCPAGKKRIYNAEKLISFLEPEKAAKAWKIVMGNNSSSIKRKTRK